LEQAIVDAAWQELTERGWAGFTVEGVAARSGAAKTVIYRRWRNRVHLAQDMLLRATTDSDAVQVGRVTAH
jgi:AcrR family transcriptional regulator